MKAMRMATVAALALLLCFSGSVNAQFPPGLFDGVAAVASQPGAVTSFASSQSGQPPVAWTSGGPGGAAMASSSGSGGTMTSTTINGVTQTTVNGNAVRAVAKPATGTVVAGARAVAGAGASSGGGCTSISSTNTQACDGPSGACCAVTSTVRRCDKHAHARGSINGQSGLCCITLFMAKDKSPALWCAGAPSKAYYALPSSARVSLKPSCSTSFKGSKAGSLSCTVTLKTIPNGFLAPRGYNTAKPLLYNKGTGFQPCMSPSFNRVLQVDSAAKDGGIAFTSKCE